MRWFDALLSRLMPRAAHESSPSVPSDDEKPAPAADGENEAAEPTFGPERIVSPTVRLLYDYLKQIGIDPEVDGDGDLRFRYQVLHFLGMGTEDDPPFLQLALPGIYRVGEAERPRVLEVANRLTHEYKVGKIRVTDDYVWVVVDAFVDSADHVEQFVMRYLNLMMAMREEFHQAMEQ